MQCNIILTDENERYLLSCARIRHISYMRLVERLVKAICEDQLVLAVLDDDSRPIIDSERRSFYRRRDTLGDSDLVCLNPPLQKFVKMCGGNHEKGKAQGSIG